MSEVQTDPTDIKRPQYELMENGEIRYNRKGKSTLLAKYDDETGVLTFESFEIDRKYRVQICRAITEDTAGELTGNAIRAYHINGRPFDKKRPGEPLPPKKNKMLGDKTPEFVRWMFKWRPQAAYAQYGVFLDSNGEPVTAPCFRSEQGLLQPDKTGKALKVFGDGKDALSQTVTESEEGILALRSTCMTFTRNERVDAIAGEEEEDDDTVPLAGGDAGAEAEGDGEPAAPRARRGRPKSIDAEGGDD